MSKERLLSVGLLALLVVLAAALWWTATQSGSWYEQALVYAQEQQRSFTQQFGAGISRMTDAATPETFFSLLVLGFLYGVFHAVGPGHGKAVITAYALTHESRLRRTAGLAFASALVQGVTAVAAVGGIALLVEGSMRRAALSVDNYLEPASYGAVALVGLYLAMIGLRRIWRLYVRAWHPVRHAGAGHAHHHHDHDGCCDHAHGPTLEEVERAGNWVRAAMVVVSVGIRPCSGAILVLVLTYSVGLFLSGVAAVLAMSLGTGLTVSAIALTAQSTRWPLARLADGLGLSAAPLSAGTALLGGGVIFAIGSGLLHGALSAPAHPLY